MAFAKGPNQAGSFFGSIKPRREGSGLDRTTCERDPSLRSAGTYPSSSPRREAVPEEKTRSFRGVHVGGRRKRPLLVFLRQRGRHGNFRYSTSLRYCRPARCSRRGRDRTRQAARNLTPLLDDVDCHCASYLQQQRENEHLVERIYPSSISTLVCKHRRSRILKRNISSML